ncbi:uncharacterized protein LOC129890538 [Solanum dulcamara]|uniref:uncharacterized protein LOC129890538 n=1 Tax=Solanum dulcamara TaxID=45834 RepID=UPI0024854FB1|nr:uncharacterized protein LOC129890538 [Solanum dulcamara]
MERFDLKGSVIELEKSWMLKQIWEVRIETYLDTLDLWEAVEEDYDIPSLPHNPTIVQIKEHKEKKTKKSNAKACLFVVVSSTVFTRIMSLKTAKEVWDYLKEEYVGDERIKGVQVLNLIREFELQNMKEYETVKEYSNRLLNLANKVRLLGSTLVDSRIVEKILVIVPERVAQFPKSSRAKKTHETNVTTEGALNKKPEGFAEQGKGEKVCLLEKAFYGLKQASRAWYSRIDDHLLSLEFERSVSEVTLYVKHKGTDLLIVSLYVNDLLEIGNNVWLVEEFKKEMM